MAIIVETGAGLSNANGYITVSACDTYHSDRGNTTWTGTNDEKTIAIKKATEYLDATYTWIGVIKKDTQALGWPRDFAYDKDGRSLANIVPQGVERACAELALKALHSTLLSDTDNSNYVKKEKVDVLEVEYSNSAPIGKQYRYVSRLLKGLTLGTSDGSNARLLRV